MTMHHVHSRDLAAPPERGTPPAAVRVSSRESGARLDRLARIGGVATPAALAALAVLHAAWALGWRWPGGSDRELAERVLSGGTELPPVAATWVVAIALGSAAAVVRAAAASDAPSPVVRRLAWGVAGLFLIRGTVYVPIDLVRGLDGLYERLDLAIYSPLCLAIGSGAAIVARYASPASPARRAATARSGNRRGSVSADSTATDRETR